MRRMGRRKLKIRINKKLLILVVVIAVIIGTTFNIEKNIKPTIKSMAELRVNLLANEIINKTIYEEILKEVNYHDLIKTHKDIDNKVTLVQANSIQISRIMAITNLKIKEALAELNEQEFYIPLGQVLGSYVFAAHGPKFKIKTLAAGELEVNLRQDFHESGINQTRHIIYLDINTAIKVVMPMVTDKVIITTKTPIAETIIIGPVPDTIVRFGNMEGLWQGMKSP